MCAELKLPENATMMCDDEFMFKSHCKVFCDEGYTLDDPEHEYDPERGITCRSDGSWCGEFPQCISGFIDAQSIVIGKTSNYCLCIII